MPDRHKNKRGHRPMGTGPDPSKDRSGHESARGTGKRVGKKKMKSLSSNLSRKILDNHEFMEAVTEFHLGSDRVSALLGAALIEDSLMGAIVAVLADPSDKSALFHDGGSPFGTFSAKIVAGKALGLFDGKVEADLDIIRDIRNQFAHALMKLDFDNPLIVERCLQISPYPTSESGDDRKVSKARKHFERACWAISLSLEIRRTEEAEKKVAALEAKFVAAAPPLTLGDLVASLSESRDYNIPSNIPAD